MKNRVLVVSTGNKNKLKEIKEILEGLPIKVISKDEIDLGNFDVVEDGNSLEENSFKKAKALSELTEYMVLADDTGLFVDALNGQPGVYSSRYAGEEGNDFKNRKKLLEEMKGIPLKERTAKFKTVIALITEEKEPILVEGTCKGIISLEERGQKGFGYDPVFIPDGYKGSFSEIGIETKNKISHRGKALDKLRERLESMLE